MKSPTRDKTNDGPLPILFSILKIYPVFDPCKSWGRDVIPRSVGARGTMSINKYLPYLTYIYTLATYDDTWDLINKSVAN